MEGKPIKGPKDLAKTIGAFDPESKVSVSIWRNGGSQKLEVTLGSVAGGNQFASNSGPSTGNLGQMGLELKSAPDGGGVLVTDVAPGSGAADKGIKPGDVIASVNGHRSFERGF